MGIDSQDIYPRPPHLLSGRSVQCSMRVCTRSLALALFFCRSVALLPSLSSIYNCITAMIDDKTGINLRKMTCRIRNPRNFYRISSVFATLHVQSGEISLLSVCTGWPRHKGCVNLDVKFHNVASHSCGDWPSVSYASLQPRCLDSYGIFHKLASNFGGN